MHVARTHATGATSIDDAGRKQCPQCGTEYSGAMLFCARDGAPLSRLGTAGSPMGELLAGRYAIGAKLGEGGMGVVYRAEQMPLGKPCALKLLHADLADDPAAVGRFRREARNASRITHPNVVALLDFGEAAGGRFYLAMELVEGESLADVLAREGALPPERAANVVRQIADALSAADDVGVVHRDLKPENVLLTRRRDGSDVVKVVDFGIAKETRVHGQTITRTGVVIGTPAFVSPEQLMGQADLDGRSDVYALGLIAFELFTGVRAFPASSFGDATRRLVAESPQLRRVRPDVDWSSALQHALDRALAIDRDARWPVAAAFGAAVADAVRRRETGDGAAPVGPGAAPASTAPVGRPAARRPLLVAGGATFTLLVLGAAWTMTDGRAPADDRAAARTAARAVEPPARAVPTPDAVRAPAPEQGRGQRRVAEGHRARDVGAPRLETVAPPAPAVGTGAAVQGAASDTAAGEVARPPAPQDGPSSAHAATIDHLRTLAGRDQVPRADARAALASARALLPQLTESEDVVHVSYFAAEIAYVHLGDAAAACELLRQARRRAAGSRLAREVQRYFADDSPVRCA